MSIQLINNHFIAQNPIITNDNFNKQPTILIFDSGIGGLSIYYKVKQILPNAHYLYVFDNEGFPYGNKSELFIIKRVLTIVDAILKLHKLHLVIVACNTASIISLPTLRKYLPCLIIGVVPALKPAALLTRNGIIGLLATCTTIQCSYTNNLISQFTNNCEILKLGMTELVHMVEAKLQGKTLPLSVLRKLLFPWLEAIKPPDTIVLGCTHFPLIKKELQAVLPKGTNLVDSGTAVALRAASLLKHNIDMNNYLHKKPKHNQAYCITTTSKTVILKSVLTRCGFKSLKPLILQIN